MSLIGFASAIDGNSVELQPGEDTAEPLFNYGIGEPWVSGNSPSLSASDSMYSQYYSIYNGPSNKNILKPQRSMR